MNSILRSLFLLLSLLIFSASSSQAQKFAVVSGDWNGSIWALETGGAAGSATVPGAADSVIINAGVTVSVTGTSGVSSSISFGDATAKIAMDTGSVLTVHGHFTLAATTHNAFASWAPGAKVVLAGSNDQKLQGWSTTGFSTSFNYLQVDKTGGKAVTEGVNMRLGIGDTLEILNGTFEIASTDDIESRNAAGSATSFTMIVQPGGTFTMVGSTSHIRRASNTSLELKRIGKVIVYGSATMRSTSTNGLNFSGIDVEAGGELVAASFSNSAVGNFNCGTVTVKEGGELRVISTAPFWEPTTAAVILNQGGTLRSNAATQTNTFPPSFTNDGTVRYGSSNDQTIKDMDYHRLELSFGGLKIWTVEANRIIADSLEINNSADLRFSAASPQTVTVNGTVRLTSGIINNLDSGNVNIVLADNANVSRATGEFALPVIFGSSVNLRYTSSVQTVTPGPEMPSDPSTLKQLTVAAPMGISLGSPVTVNNELTLDDGFVYLNEHPLTFAADAVMSGTLSDSSMVVYNGSGTMKKLFASPSSFTFAIGDTVNGGRYTPATLNFTSGTFNAASVEILLTAEKHPHNMSANDFINRYWTVIPTGISSFVCDVAFGYHPSDINGTEGNIYLGRWTGSAWGPLLSKADTGNHRLFGTVTEFSEFTGGETNGLTLVDESEPVPNTYAMWQNYPNPFNPTTMISYQLPTTSSVTVTVYDILGKEVAALVNGTQEAGRYSVGLDASRYGMSSGLYFYKIDATSGARRFVRVMKMLLLK